MLLNKRFKAECARLGLDISTKLDGRSNRYETLLKQRHVQVRREEEMQLAWNFDKVRPKKERKKGREGGRGVQFPHHK